MCATEDARRGTTFTSSEKIKLLTLDCEMVTLYSKAEKDTRMPLACWVYLGGGKGRTALEEFVRYPKYQIADMGTKFHGLLFDGIKNAGHISAIRGRVIKYIAATDVLVGCNVASDLRSLGFTMGDYIAVRQKVRDVGPSRCR